MIWKFQRTVTRRLFIWNAANIFVGIIIAPLGKLAQGIGSQALGWGAINMAIAVFGRAGSTRRANLPDANTPAVLEKESRNLRNILWINAGLDVLYMVGGSALSRSGARNQDERRRGMGIGIIIQGALLFVFDVVHALIVPDANSGDQNER